MGKPTIPEVIDRFRAYHAKEPAWGYLHITLDDGNVRDDFVTYCRDTAMHYGDTEAVELADILLSMSRTQRLKLGRLA